MDTTINITCPQSGCTITINIKTPDTQENNNSSINVEIVDNTQSQEKPAERDPNPAVRPRDPNPVVRPTEPGGRAPNPVERPPVGPGRKPAQSGRIDAPKGKNSYDETDEPQSSEKERIDHPTPGGRRSNPRPTPPNRFDRG